MNKLGSFIRNDREIEVFLGENNKGYEVQVMDQECLLLSYPIRPGETYIDLVQQHGEMGVKALVELAESLLDRSLKAKENM